MNRAARNSLLLFLAVVNAVCAVLNTATDSFDRLKPWSSLALLLVPVAAVTWVWLARKPRLIQNAPRVPIFSLRLRIISTFVAVLIVLVGLTPSVQRWWERQRPPDKVIVVLAEFEDPKGMNITSHLANKLATGMAGFSDARLIRIHDTLREGTDSTATAAVGRKHKATILIWGFCDKSDTAGYVTTHFEVLRPPRYMPELSPEARGQPRFSTDMNGLGTFEFSTRVGDEMTATCLMTLGMVHYSAGD